MAKSYQVNSVTMILSFRDSYTNCSSQTKGLQVILERRVLYDCILESVENDNSTWKYAYVRRTWLLRATFTSSDRAVCDKSHSWIGRKAT